MHSASRVLLPALLLALLTPAIALAAGAGSAPAQGQQHIAPPGVGNTPGQMPVLYDIQGVTSWSTLAKVKQVKVKNRILPEFSKDIAALNNQEIKVQGFMMPLEPGEKQKHFLISLVPQSCSFCLPAGPEGVVEVKSKTPVKYTLEPIIVSGKMEIMKDDPMGLYYRMNNATLASNK